VSGDGNPADHAAYVRRPSRPSRPARGRTPAPVDHEEQRVATGLSWDVSHVDLRRIAPSGSDRARQRFRSSLPDLIWNTAALEGNTFTLPEVRTLLDGVSVGGRPLEDQEQILALSEGYSRLDETVGNGSFRLTKDISDELHLLVAAREAIEAGHFRGEGAATGGGTVRLANGGTVPGLEAGPRGTLLVARYDHVLRFLRELSDPRERALAYFAIATRSQFYFDGNKRTARLMMSGELMLSGFEAVSIPYARQYEFNVALDELFEKDDATTLMGFIASCA
jgi:Fic family protein